MNAIDHSQVLAAAMMESGLLAGLLVLAVLLRRAGVNGPCCLCLALLLAWRVSAVAALNSHSPDTAYFLGLLFGYVFLYMTYHLAHLIHKLRTGRPAGLPSAANARSGV